MGKSITVKGMSLDGTRPKICVPIVNKTAEKIIKQAELLQQADCDLVEWRIDYFEEVDQIEYVKQTLDQMGKVLEKPVIVTFRTKQEGGEKAIDPNRYIALLKGIIETKKADFIDVELFLGDELVKELITYAHAYNVKVIVSNHDFNQTPIKEEIKRRLCHMQQLGADIPKIAVMPQQKSDVIALLEATYEVSSELSTTIVTMSMGKLGVISRISGSLYGSAMTFASYGAVSAPGQIPVEQMREILDVLAPQ